MQRGHAASQAARAALAGLCLLAAGARGAEAPGAPPPFALGVNLAGAEFAGGVLPGVDGRHYAWPSARTLDYWREAGVTLVRLPFKWERLQPRLMGEFDPAYRDGLLRSLRLMRERGIWAIPDVHNYGRYRGSDAQGKIGSETVPCEAFADLWRRLALLLGGEPNIWAYGLMNEPHLAGDGGVDWRRCAQAASDAIRQVDGRTTILVANDYAGWAATAQPEETLADWAEKNMLIATPALLQDPAANLRFEVHVYFDHDNSGLYRHSYAEEAARGRVTPLVGVKRLMPFVKWLARHGAKGFVGEFGCPANPGVDTRWLDVLENTLACLKEQRLPATLWAAGDMWTPGTAYVAERRGWSRDLPDDVRDRHRPQTLLLQRHMEPPRIAPEDEVWLAEYRRLPPSPAAARGADHPGNQDGGGAAP